VIKRQIIDPSLLDKKLIQQLRFKLNDKLKQNPIQEQFIPEPPTPDPDAPAPEPWQIKYKDYHDQSKLDNSPS